MYRVNIGEFDFYVKNADEYLVEATFIDNNNIECVEKSHAKTYGELCVEIERDRIRNIIKEHECKAVSNMHSSLYEKLKEELGDA